MAKEKNQAAVELGRKGGLARARKLTKKQRSEAARNAANQLWKNKKPQGTLTVT